MPNPDNLIGKGFDAHPEHINRAGRPKKWQSELLEMGYTKSQQDACYSGLLGQTVSKVMELRDDETQDFLIRNTAKAMIKAWEKGTLYVTETMITRTFGQPKESVDVKQTTAVFHVSFNEDINTEDGSKMEKE